MYKVKVYVTLREGIIEPQGAATKQALHEMDYKEVSDVRFGKYIELQVEKSDRPIEEVVKEMCERLLVNAVVENYRFEIEEEAVAK